MRFLDFVYKRYANPLELIDRMMRIGRFEEFVNEIPGFRNEEEKEQTLWEYWLHRIHDKSFAEFWAEANGETTAENETPSDEVLTETVLASKGIFDSFCLPLEGDENGDIPPVGESGN